MTADSSGRPTLDREAAQARADLALLAWGASGNVREEAEALARDVLAYEAALASETERADQAVEAFDSAHEIANREAAARIEAEERADRAERERDEWKERCILDGAEADRAGVDR